jgi:hypothetical protein
MPPPQAPLQRSAPVHAVTPAAFSRKLDLKTTIRVGRAADFDVVSTESCCGARRGGERAMVCAFIGTAFAQDDAAVAKAPWRSGADQPRPKPPKHAGSQW